jgi:hypothetical protein
VSARTGIDERAVVDVWERQAFDMAALAGVGLRVLYRGRPSDAGGPDYQDAMFIRTDRELVAGDVEFHVRTSDWNRHRHHLDPRYNNVILHVVWHDDLVPVARQDGRPVPTLALSPCVTARPLGPGAALLPHRCIAAYSRLETEELLGAIRTCGRRRLEERSALLAADLTVSEPDQVLYTALLEACGYASNRAAFRALADVAPFSWVMSLSPEQRLAALLDAAGLGAASSSDLVGRLPAGSWRIARLRPANHPVKRLAGLVTVLERHGPRLAESLTDLVLRQGSPAHLRDSVRTRGQGAAIGVGRADEIVASVLLPFVGAQGYMEEAWETYCRYPSPPANRWTRHMVQLMQRGGHSVRLRYAVEHQGLHYLYHSHCRAEGTPGCPVCSAQA